MVHKLVITALILALAPSIQANDATRAESDGILYLTEQFAMHEKQIQQLLNRIEILEHNYKQLQDIPKSSIITPYKEVSGNSSDSKIIPEKENKIVDATGAKSLYTIALATFKEASNMRDANTRANKFTEAQNSFKRFIAEYPGDTLISNAYFWLGEILFQQKQYKEAILHYKESYKIASSQNHAQKSPYDKSADSLLKIAMSLSAMNQCTKACQVMNTLEEQFPSQQRSSNSRAYSREICNKCGCSSAK